jgi:hypothetical protein
MLEDKEQLKMRQALKEADVPWALLGVQPAVQQKEDEKINQAHAARLDTIKRGFAACMDARGYSAKLGCTTLLNSESRSRPGEFDPARQPAMDENSTHKLEVA